MKNPRERGHYKGIFENFVLYPAEDLAPNFPPFLNSHSALTGRHVAHALPRRKVNMSISMVDRRKGQNNVATSINLMEEIK